MGTEVPPPPPPWAANAAPPPPPWAAGIPAAVADQQATPPGALPLPPQPSAGLSDQQQLTSLPLSFMSQGLTYLRQGNFQAAADFYQDLVKREPQRAHGWYGVGACLLATNDLSNGVRYLAKGKELDPKFPVGALVNEAQPGHPRVLYNMAEVALKKHTLEAVTVALDIIDEVLNSPMTPASLYAKADQLKKKAKNDQDWLRAHANPDLLALKHEAVKQMHVAAFLRWIFLMVFVAAACVVGYYTVRWFHADAESKMGHVDFNNALSLEHTGEAKTAVAADEKDPLRLYHRAYTHFVTAVELNPRSIDATFMEIHSAEKVLQQNQVSRSYSRPTDREIKDIKAHLAAAKKVLPTLDPGGHEITRLEEALTQQEAAAANH
jgi:tetratricopeptide (TPR) repeat protein